LEIELFRLEAVDKSDAVVFYLHNFIFPTRIIRDICGRGAHGALYARDVHDVPDSRGFLDTHIHSHTDYIRSGADDRGHNIDFAHCFGEIKSLYSVLTNFNHFSPHF
jgi:hypothetical protein